MFKAIKLESLIMGAAVMLLPFFSCPGLNYEFQFPVPKLMGLFLFGSLVLAYKVLKEVHWTAGLLVAVFCSSVLYTGYGLEQVMFASWFIPLVIICLWLLETKERSLFFLDCVAWSGAIAASYAYIQIFDLNFIFKYADTVDRTLPISFFGQTTRFGCFIAITGSIALARKKYVPFIFQIVPAILTGSSFTCGALLVGCLVGSKHLISKKTAFGIAGSIGLVLLTLLYFKPWTGIFVGSGRTEVWETSINATIHGAEDRIGVKDKSGKIVHPFVDGHPLIGFGPGVFWGLFQHFQPDSLHDRGIFVQAHNDYVQCFFEFGLLGLIPVFLGLFFIGLYFILYWLLDYNYLYPLSGELSYAASAGAAAILVNAVGNFPFCQAPQNLIGAFCISVLLRNFNHLKFEKYYGRE